MTRRGVESTLSITPVRSLGRKLLSDRVLVLAYHNVVPDTARGIGDASLHLCVSDFAAQLDVLRGEFDVVPLKEALRVRAQGTGPRVAVTFDDAYRGAVRLGVSELVARGMPATVFACPGRLDGHEFWWDRYLGGGAGTVDPTEFRQAALTEHQGRDESVAALAESRGVKAVDLPPECGSASLEELRDMTLLPGITIGSHTWSHSNLAEIPAVDRDRELTRSARWLRAEFGERYVPIIAYPYGFASSEVEAGAEAEYEAGMVVTGGWFRPGATLRWRVPRMNVPAGMTRAGFMARLSGFLGRPNL